MKEPVRTWTFIWNMQHYRTAESLLPAIPVPGMHRGRPPCQPLILTPAFFRCSSLIVLDCWCDNLNYSNTTRSGRFAERSQAVGLYYCASTLDIFKTTLRTESHVSNHSTPIQVRCIRVSTAENCRLRVDFTGGISPCWRPAMPTEPPGAYRGSEPISFVSITTLAA